MKSKTEQPIEVLQDKMVIKARYVSHRYSMKALAVVEPGATQLQTQKDRVPKVGYYYGS